MKIITDADSAEVITSDMPTNDAGNMLVLEDVIIEDESEAILRQDESANILEYTYETDINAHAEGLVLTLFFLVTKKVYSGVKSGNFIF